MHTVKIDTAASGNTTLVTGSAGRRIVVLGYHLVAAGPVTATVKSDTTALTGPMSMVAGVPHDAAIATWLVGGPQPHLEGAGGEALVLTLSGAVQVSGHLTYTLRPG